MRGIGNLKTRVIDTLITRQVGIIKPVQLYHIEKLKRDNHGFVGTITILEKKYLYITECGP